MQARAVHCNYCMGYCEIRFRSAGWDKPAITNQTKLLAKTDWSAFPTEEQVAYADARTLCATPW